MTVTGSTGTAEAIRESAAVLGFESCEIEPDGDIQFVDWPFRAEGFPWEEHLDAVQRNEPEIATAPDIEPGMAPSEVYDMGDRLLDAGADHVLIVSKHPDVHPAEIPDRFRIGIPFAGEEFSGGTPWRLADYIEAGEVHLLGGSPLAQFEAGRYVDVASVDTSSPQVAATWGDYIDPDEPDSWSYAGEGADFYDTIRATLDGMVAAWADLYDYDRPTEVAAVDPPDADPAEALGYGRPEEADPEEGLWKRGDTGPAGERVGGGPDRVGPDPEEVATTEISSVTEQANEAGIEPIRGD